MTAALDAETKRLRKLSPGALADEIGALKAEISDRETQLGKLKEEAIRRGLSSADGSLFRITLSPPGERSTLDGELLKTVFGQPFIDHFSKTSPTGRLLRCFGRKAEATKAAA